MATTPRRALADLLAKRKAHLGLGLEDLAARCVDPMHPGDGPQWTRSTLSNLLSGRMVKLTGPSAVRALAAGFDLPLDAVQQAAAEQYFDWKPIGLEDDLVALVAHWDEMNDLEKAQLRRIAQAFAEERRKHGPGE
ncbi:helix-turn-helix domain-containing protein [Streptomyces sp. OF3]|uniref:Helix-turn-helix domain-containing protein n=1 Tax=Streptomyces alkaliterrae TaxID=2213162 RepID=A0A7W3WID2_9ACTN|nr:helix-turn-helix transcriptional regulator [Streptomyces alkaliterrae]MBB1252904.1 helix-turn-helix domain-containing protein [Streptomyces alkaliterrae]